MAMRGLTQFIGDIRNCANKEDERKRVDKEMANIRKHFKEATKLTPYQKKKYVWKMLYIYVLGYEVDFGHMEALNLITATGYSEKTVGYLACVLLLSETNEFLRLIINSTKNDLMSANEEIQGLSLACVANVGGREFAETLTVDVQKLLFNPSSRPQVKKKAALCMLRLLRKYPDNFAEDGIGGNPEQRDKLLDLLEDSSLGVVTATMSLLLGLVSHNPELWTDSVNKCSKLLAKLNHPNASKEYGPEYVYYKTINPWLQVKVLRLLQYYPPPEREEVYKRLCDVLQRIISETSMGKNVNTNNSAHAVVFEAVNYVIHIESNQQLIHAAVNMLGQRITSGNQPNYRYLALDAMQRMSHIPEAAQQFKRHQETIIRSLKDNDVSLRRRSLDVLYSMCDSNNSEQVVGELLDYLANSDFSIREELVLRVAILAERFSPNLQWYVDTILKLMSLAGDYVSDQVWMRVVQIVTNHEDLQLYAAETCYKALKNERVHESMIKCGGYILGEFGHHIASKRETSAEEQFALLKEKFDTCDHVETKQLLLTAFIKLVNVHPDKVKEKVAGVLQAYTSTIDAELQQRAVEYLTLSRPDKESMLEAVLDVMPSFPERENILTKKIKERERLSTTDRSAAQVKSGGKGEEEEEELTVELSMAAAASTKHKSSVAAPANGGAAAAAGDLLDLSEPAKSTMDDLLGGGGGGGGGGGLDDLLGGGPPAAQKPAGGGGMDDLLGLAMGGGGGAPAAGGGGGGLDDLLGGGGGGGGNVGTVAAPGASLEAVYRAVAAGQGQTLETADQLAVQCQVAVQGNVGKVMMRYQNKAGFNVDNLSVQLAPAPYLNMQAQPVQPQIMMGAFCMQQFQFQVKDYFGEPPKLTLRYSRQGQQVAQDTWLPISLTKFFQPVQCTKEQYFNVWGKINGAPNEITKVFKGKKPIVKQEVEQCVTGAKYSVLQGVDKPENVVGAAKVNLGQGDVYCVIRLEMEPAQQAFKLTVKTSNANVTEATRSFLMHLLAAQA